jgi:hypothetical protein
MAQVGVKALISASNVCRTPTGQQAERSSNKSRTSRFTAFSKAGRASDRNDPAACLFGMRQASVRLTFGERIPLDL